MQRFGFIGKRVIFFALATWRRVIALSRQHRGRFALSAETGICNNLAGKTQSRLHHGNRDNPAGQLDGFHYDITSSATNDSVHFPVHYPSTMSEESLGGVGSPPCVHSHAETPRRDATQRRIRPRNNDAKVRYAAMCRRWGNGGS